MRDPWVIDNIYILIRLFLSVFLGGLIGFERERNNHAAGLRTHILVCLGSCLVMMLSMYGFSAFVNEPNVRLDPARLAAQVITGIGFLGAGTIVMTGRGISGLTTAASVWVVMAIGLAVGAGFYFPAVISSFLVLFTLWALNIVEKRYMSSRLDVVFTLTVDEHSAPVDQLQRLLKESDAKLKKIHFQERTGDGRNEEMKGRGIRLTVQLNRRELVLPLAEKFGKLEGVCSVSAE